MPYLTPETIPADDLVCRVIEIPNDLNLLAAVNAALLQLTAAYNWEKSSLTAKTPEQTADAMFTMYYGYSTSMCRVIGEVRWFGTATLPDWCLPCDGTLYNKADYPALAAVIGGLLDASGTQFRTPDLRRRSPEGTGAFNGTGLDFDVGQQEGKQAHTLTLSQIPAHTHGESIAVPAIINGGLEAPASAAVPGTGVTGSAGGGSSHPTIGPRIALRAGMVWK
jgi:hypothetical protein